MRTPCTTTSVQSQVGSVSVWEKFLKTTCSPALHKGRGGHIRRYPITSAKWELLLANSSPELPSIAHEDRSRRIGSGIRQRSRKSPLEWRKDTTIEVRTQQNARVSAMGNAMTGIKTRKQVSLTRAGWMQTTQRPMESISGFSSQPSTTVQAVGPRGIIATCSSN